MYEPAVTRIPGTDQVQLSHNTQRLITLGETQPEDLALALAWDALSLVPAATLVGVRLRRPHERCHDLRLARPGMEEHEIEGDASLTVPIRAAHGRAGSISVWAQPGASLSATDEFTLISLSWLASTAIDRHALREAEDRWQFDKRRLDATFSAAPVGIAHVAPDGTFLSVNERFAAMTGRTREALLVGGFQSITHPDDLADDIAHVDALLSGTRDRYMMEKRYLLPDGSPVWVNLTVALVRDADGAPEFFVSVIEDVSEVKRAHAAATQDPLTGLLNRRGLMKVLPDDLARCQASECPLSLIYIDLNDFKRVNDHYGHGRGDACLAQSGAKLTDAIGTSGSVARIGGDEFVVTVPGATCEDAAALLARLDASLNSVTIAPGWQLTASYGCSTAEAGSPLSAEQLIEAADKAMFRDKRRGRS